jgi:hypothetical protein
MVNAEDVIEIIERFSAGRIQVWVCGGWGIDALLGRGPFARRTARENARTASVLLALWYCSMISLGRARCSSATDTA